MTTRLYKRVKAGHLVGLSVSNLESGATVEGSAFMTNLSLDGLCLTDVKWKGETSLTDPHGQIDVHLPIPDWVGVDLKVKPVRIRFSDDTLEIGAVIVKRPERFQEALEALGYSSDAPHDDGDPIP